MDDLVAVIGGGPAGLAAAATLQRASVPVRVFDSGDEVGSRWRDHYDRLHLHTARTLSALPGMAIPAEVGRWVSRDAFVSYQQAYARFHGVDVELGTTVERVDRVGDRWRVVTSAGNVDASHVVVATGYNNVPYLPEWPGRESFRGEVVHSRAYRTGRTYEGKRVMVVGTGNTGAEIATDLAEQGAAEVWWSVRTAPTILPRSLVGIPIQAIGIVLRPLSPRIVDPIMALVNRLWAGDLRRYGLGRPARGGYTRVLQDRVLPILDVGIVAAVKRRAVWVVPTVNSFEESGVVLADGRHVAVDVVVACTGYRTALPALVGHLGVLSNAEIPLVSGSHQHPSAPGMYFLGYTNALSGNLREIAAHARQVAAAIAGGRELGSIHR